jgi:aspartyl-tRNA(Asn)/glutamyl-tRNA(Gln) amidotransferase subunit C
MRRTFHKAPCIIACLLKTALLPTRRANLQYRKYPVSLNKDQVQHIAMLARLKLDEGEYAESVEKLSKIVDFVDQLSQADTAGVVPMAHPLDAAQRLRPDVVTEADQRDYYQQNAEAVSGGLYLVPKVIE